MMMKRLLFSCLLLALAWGCSEDKGTVVSMETSEGRIRVRLYDETVLHKENMVKLVKDGYYNGLLFHRVIQDFMIQGGDPDSRTARKGDFLGNGGPGYSVKAEILPQFFHKKGVLAAAREGNDVNPMKNSSGSQFYIVQGKKFTREQLDQLVEKMNQRRYRTILKKLEMQHKAEAEALEADPEGLGDLRARLEGKARAALEKERYVMSDGQYEAYQKIGGTPHLDGEYTVFGEVIEGMEVVDRIAAVQTDRYDRPEKDVVILKMEVE